MPVSDSGAGAEARLRLVHARPLACRVTEIADPTPQIRIIRLVAATGSRFCFLAGQYAMLAFGGHRPRPFSMANRPDDPSLEFHVRHGSAIGEGASAHAAALLRRGDGVWLEGPFGEAFLRERHVGPIIGVAGGTGVAPLLSIVATALDLNRDRPVRLYVGARDESELYAASRLDRLVERHPNFSWMPVLSQPGLASARRAGMVTDALAADLAAAPLPGVPLPGILSFEAGKASKAYIAGPPPMVAAAIRILRAAGIAEADLHADALTRAV